MAKRLNVLIQKMILLISSFIVIGELILFSSQSVFAVTSINMYYCKTADNTCAKTSSPYTADTAGVTACKNNLAQYLGGQTTGVCYTTQTSCTTACATNTFQCPSKCSGNYDYTKTSVYTSTTANCANPVAGTITYSCDCACGANSIQHLTYGTCTQQCAQTASKKMHYCNSTSKTCVETADAYINTTACQANLTQFLAGQTTGICYDTPTNCQAACGVNITPTPITTCKTDFCGTTPEVGCLVTCCTKTPGETRCVTKVGPTPTPDPNTPPPEDVPDDQDQTNPPVDGKCACANDTCNTACKFDALLDVVYSPTIRCELSPSLFTTAPSLENKNAWCASAKKTMGDADGNGMVNNMDYLYYVSAVNGGTIPSSVNPDFNGDGEIGFADRSIIIKSLGGL